MRQNYGIMERKWRLKSLAKAVGVYRLLTT